MQMFISFKFQHVWDAHKQFCDIPFDHFQKSFPDAADSLEIKREMKYSKLLPAA